MDVVSTWNQGLFFDVNWQPKFNVVSTLFLGRCINVVELTLFQRGIRVDFSSTSFNDVVAINRLAIDARTICIFNIFTTSFRLTSDVVSTLYRRLFAHWEVVVKSLLQDFNRLVATCVFFCCVCGQNLKHYSYYGIFSTSITHSTHPCLVS